MRHLSPGNVLAAIAVFVALGGTSYAAATLAKNSVRSSTIRNGEVKAADLARSAVTSAKVRNGSLTKADFAAGTLPPAGATGPAGPAGAPGRDGTSAFAATLPAGTQLTGLEALHVYGNGTENVRGLLDLGRPLPSGTPVRFTPSFPAADSGEDAACAGTFGKPTAPAGMVCIYPGATGGLAGGSATATPIGTGQLLGARLSVDGSGIGETLLELSWAYTAP